MLCKEMLLTQLQAEQLQIKDHTPWKGYRPKVGLSALQLKDKLDNSKIKLTQVQTMWICKN